MPIVLPHVLADRIEGWLRGDPNYTAMVLGDLLSEQELIHCVVLLRDEAARCATSKSKQ